MNGIRSCLRKGFLEWLITAKPDYLCLQEVRADLGILPTELKNLSGYHLTLFPAEKKGYAGTATLSREKPLSVEKGIGLPKFDCEGRTLLTEFSDFYLLNTYFPNSQPDLRRLDFKQEFNAAYFQYIEKFRQNPKPLIFTGDFNVAHREIDLARPKQNTRSAGFTAEERAFTDQLVTAGYLDTFRHFYPREVKYSWWSYRSAARERNVGWRIDYFFLHQDHRKILQDAGILNEVYGSDHCPVELILK